MFKKIKDPNFDYKFVVINGYNNCAEKYQNARKHENEQSLDYIFENVPAKGSILDVGCGSGIPVCKILSPKYKIIGIDISEKQIKLAKKNVPTGTFIKKDILDYESDRNSINAIISFYTLFHIPKEKHQNVLSKYYDWLKPGGILLITLANVDEDAYTKDDFFEKTMYWSNFGIKKYVDILEKVGFRILKQEELGHGYENILEKDEHHPLVLAMKGI